MDRENFKSRLGFILVSAGCAIGIGNVWKFPYVTGANGGGVFVLFYLLFLVIMGIPVITMELAVGRSSRQSAVQAYRTLEKPGSPWHIHGWFCIAGCFILMMYYTTVSGWMLNYFVKFLMGNFETMGEEGVGGVFFGMLGDPGQMVLYMAITVVAGIAVCSFSLQGGVERITKIMMIGLLVLICVLAVHSLTLKGAKAGVAFYLLPDFKLASKVGIGKVMTAAMNQAFFTLSLGVGAIEIFGSYTSRDYSLTGEAVRIAGLDTFVAIVSGLIIFPACFSYGIETTQGPSLIFITLPEVFIHMAGGRIWGTLFFIFMTFASFSTVIAVFENLIAACMDSFGWSRQRAAAVNLVCLLVASLPCALGYNVLSSVHLIGGRDILDSEDFIVSNLLLPLGSLVFALFCSWNFGWGFDNYIEETNTGEGIKMPRFLKPYFQVGLPVLILVILIQGLLPAKG